VLKANVDRDTDDIGREAVRLIREAIGPVAAFKTAICVKRLPKQMLMAMALKMFM